MPLFPATSGFFPTSHPCSRRLPGGSGIAGKEDESAHEVSQEELVKRDAPPSDAAGCPGVPGCRRCCVGADSASVGLGRRQARVLRSQASELDSDLVLSFACGRCMATHVVRVRTGIHV